MHVGGAVPLTGSVLAVHQEFSDDECGKPSTDSGVSFASILTCIFHWHVGNDGGVYGSPQAGNHAGLAGVR
jgi:hypothetical protein